LFLGTAYIWLLITGSLVFGPKLIEVKAMISVPLRFILIIIFVVKYAGLNSSVDGDGIGYYIGGTQFPLPDDFTGTQKYM
jgi:hypothetical protein